MSDYLRKQEQRVTRLLRLDALLVGLYALLAGFGWLTHRPVIVVEGVVLAAVFVGMGWWNWHWRRDLRRRWYVEHEPWREWGSGPGRD